MPGRLTKFRINISRFRVELDTRVLRPAVINLPCFAQSERRRTSDRRIRQEPQYSKLRIARKDEFRIRLQYLEPAPGIVAMHVIGNRERQPHVHIREE